MSYRPTIFLHLTVDLLLYSKYVRSVLCWYQ